MRRGRTEIDEATVWAMFQEAILTHDRDESEFWDYVDHMIEEGELDYDAETGKFYRG